MIVLNSGNTEYLLDTYAWIEYFIGSEEGLKVKNLLEHQFIHTSVISIAELSDKYHRENLSSEWQKRYQFIISKSSIVPCSLKVMKNSGFRKLELRKKHKSIGLVDAIIIETAIQLDLILVSGDLHFETIENIFYLKN